MSMFGSAGSVALQQPVNVECEHRLRYLPDNFDKIFLTNYIMDYSFAFLVTL